MDTAYSALGRFVVRFRYLIVMATQAITIVSVSAFPSLDSGESVLVRGTHSPP